MNYETVREQKTASQMIGGIPFQISSLQGAVERIIALGTGTHEALNVRFLNAWNVALAHRDGEYRSLLARRGINFPDGMPVVWLLKLRGTFKSTAGRVRGPSVFTQVMRQGVPQNLRHYLLGGSTEVLDRLASTLTDKYDEVQIVGRFAPPFAPVTHDFLAQCIEQIRPTAPDLVWVGLGTPKQDWAGDVLCAALGIPVLNVGAAFDFAAGTKREAPAWIQRSGFEWLFRLASEPRRLWRRYLVGNVEFLLAVLAEWRSDRRPLSH